MSKLNITFRLMLQDVKQLLSTLNSLEDIDQNVNLTKAQEKVNQLIKFCDEVEMKPFE